MKQKEKKEQKPKQNSHAFSLLVVSSAVVTAEKNMPKIEFISLMKRIQM